MIHSFKVCLLFLHLSWLLLFHPHLTYSPCPHFHHTARPHPPSLSGSPSEVSAVPRSLRRAPREQLAGCRERGSSKGARSRMLRAKECKQVEPLHYMAPPPHSHAPPPTVSFYVDVDYTHKHTNTHTHKTLHSTTTFFEEWLCVCVFFLTSLFPVLLLDHKTSKQQPHFPQGAYFPANILWSRLSPGSVHVWNTVNACACACTLDIKCTRIITLIYTILFFLNTDGHLF